MNDSDRKAFFETWASAWEQYGKTVTDRMLKMAFECLREFPLADIQRGVLAHVKDATTGQFPPKPADIIRQIQGTAEDNALEAWSLVLRGIRGHYSHQANYVTFADPVIMMVVHEMGGFSTMGSCRETDLHWVQKDFMDRYAMRTRRPLDDYPKKLPTCEYKSTNSPEVILIGRSKTQSLKAITNDAA